MRIPEVRKVIAETETLLIKNRIFLDRMQGVGKHAHEGARARAGRDRARAPLDGRRRTTSARTTRTSSTTASTSTCPSARRRQLGPLHVPRRRDPPVACASSSRPRADARRRPDLGRRSAHHAPPKQDVYTTIEATIAHFKLVMEGVKPPAGDVYSFTEAATASSASTSSPTAAARPTACACVRRAGSTCRRRAR
jgi:NADH-quinone oxidoreductase subunit D